MFELSVKGIARRFRELTGAFSIKRDLLSGATGAIALQKRLISNSKLSIKGSIPDCGTVIDQGYFQFWTTIIVRVKLVPHSVDHLPTSLDRWKDYWKMGIDGIWNRQIPSSFPAGTFHTDNESAQAAWNNVQERTKDESGDDNYWAKHWVCSRSGESPCRLYFEVQWVESGEHHVVFVGDFPEAKENQWVLASTGAGMLLTGVAHEYGHMLGFRHDRIPPNGCEAEAQIEQFRDNPDLPNFPWRKTVMCAIADYGQLPSHLVQPFADNIGSNIKLVTD